MIPVSVIAGYLGAGKTTLINRLLEVTNEPMGVVVNDFGELNVDIELVSARASTALALSNGCVCCQLNDDLGAALETMKQHQLTRVIVEASGVALPARVAAYAENWPGYELESVIVMVDGSRIAALLQDKFVADLVRDQIRQADRLLITREPWTPPGETPFEYLPNVSALPETPFLNRHLQRDRETFSHDLNLSTTRYAGLEALDRCQLRAFLQRHPGIQRAKGWFTDKSGQGWLCQSTVSETDFEAVSQVPANELVVIHTIRQPLPDRID